MEFLKYLQKYQRKVKGQAKFCGHQGRDCNCDPGRPIYYGALDQADWLPNDEVFVLTGEVFFSDSPRLHANTRLNVSTKFEYRIFEENIVECNNALFGGDPVPFVPKFCWCYMYDPPTEGFVQEEKAIVEIDESYLTMIAEKEAKYHYIRKNSK